MSTVPESLPEPRKPPDWLFRYLVNPIMKGILRSPLHRAMSSVLMILTYSGRKSGKRYSTPISYHRENETVLYTFTRSNWPKNFIGGAQVSLHLQGRTVQAHAETLVNDAHVRPIVDTWVQHYGIDGSRRRGILAGVPQNPTEADIAHAMHGLMVVRFRLLES